MATNLAIDDKLIEEAKRVGEHLTKKEAVTVARSKKYIRWRKQIEILDTAEPSTTIQLTIIKRCAT